MILDFTADMVLIGLVFVALMVVAVVAIGASADRRERQAMRAFAERVGAWWANRESSPAAQNRRAFDAGAEKRRAA